MKLPVIRPPLRRGLGYVIFCLVFILSTILYFDDQEENRINRCVDGRRDLRGAIEWTVTYALGFSSETDPSDIAANERFVDGLHAGLLQQFPDEGCHE